MAVEREAVDRVEDAVLNELLAREFNVVDEPSKWFVDDAEDGVAGPMGPRNKIPRAATITTATTTIAKPELPIALFNLVSRKLIFQILEDFALRSDLLSNEAQNHSNCRQSMFFLPRLAKNA